MLFDAVDWAGRQTSTSSSKDQTIGRPHKSAGVGYDRLLRPSLMQTAQLVLYWSCPGKVD